MDTLHSVTNPVTPAVILNGRAAQVFPAIVSPAPFVTGRTIMRLMNREMKVFLSLLNFGGRKKERRKSRPGLQ